jgi:hypothetical protein
MFEQLTRRRVLQLAAAAPVGLVGTTTMAGAETQRFEHVFSFGSAGMQEGHFEYVEDFAFTPDGRLLVTDAAHAWVQVFEAATGRFLARFGGKGDEDHNLNKPEGIAVDPDGMIFVADYNTGFIQKYDATFRWLQTFAGYGTQPGQTIKSEFMDIRDGRLYVPEAGNHRVSVFDLTGRHLFCFGGAGLCCSS